MKFHFHANQSFGFTLRLALKQRHRGTRNWPILNSSPWKLVRMSVLSYFNLLQIRELTNKDNSYKHVGHLAFVKYK